MKFSFKIEIEFSSFYPIDCESSKSNLENDMKNLFLQMFAKVKRKGFHWGRKGKKIVFYDKGFQ